MPLLLFYNLCLVYAQRSPPCPPHTLKKIEPSVLGIPGTRDVTTKDEMQVVYLYNKVNYYYYYYFIPGACKGAGFA